MRGTAQNSHYYEATQPNLVGKEGASLALGPTLQRNVNSVLPGVRMFCSFKSQANFRRVFHRKLMQTLSKIESPELQNLKQNLSQDADDFLSALNFE